MHTALAYMLIYAGMARLPTSRVALLQYLYPAVALLIDGLLLGQRLDGGQWLGLGIIACAVVWAERQTAR